MINLTLATSHKTISVNPANIESIYPGEDDCTSIQVAGVKFDVIEPRRAILAMVGIHENKAKLSVSVFTEKERPPKRGEKVCIVYNNGEFIAGPYKIHAEEPMYRYIGTGFCMPLNVRPTGYILLR